MELRWIAVYIAQGRENEMVATRKKGALAVAMIASAVSSVSPVTAGANTVSEYHPDETARTFGSSAGGWTPSQASAGLCVPVLLCPAVSNTHRASDGAGGSGDGFIRTELGSLLGAASESSGIWTSPPFVYRGAGGKAADRVVLTLSRRSNVSTFLGAAGDSADFSVQVLEGAAGDELRAVPVDRAALTDRTGWTGINPVNLNPDDLRPGSTYRLRIVTRFVSGVAVAPGATSDYDNVSLRAVNITPPGNGTNGSNGQDGQNGSGGSGLSVAEVRKIIEKGMPGSAAVQGNRIFIRLRCPKRVHGRCRYGVVGLDRRGGARTTLPRFARIRGSKIKRLGLEVRPGSRESVRGKGQQLFRIRVRALGRTTTYFKRLRLVRSR